MIRYTIAGQDRWIGLDVGLPQCYNSINDIYAPSISEGDDPNGFGDK